MSPWVFWHWALCQLVYYDIGYDGVGHFDFGYYDLIPQHSNNLEF